MAQCVIFYGLDDGWTSKTAGPFRIATALRQAGFSVQCVDVTAFVGDRAGLRSVIDRVVDLDTLWVGISGTFLGNVFGVAWTGLIDVEQESDQNLDKFVTYIKKINPNIKLIHGGSRKHNLKKYGFVNFEGYVDKEIVEYTQWLNGTNKSINLNFYSDYISKKEFEHFTTSTIIYEDNDIIFKNEALPIEISRGCIFKCKFCSFPLNGKQKGEGTKDTTVLRNEFLRNYEKFGTTNYIFVDDTYNDSVDKIKLLYDEVFSQLPFEISFTAYLRLDLIMRFPETIDILKDSGLKSAVFGIETINHKSASSIGKGKNPEEQIEFIRKLKNDKWKDIIVSSGFILGLPYDTEETLNQFKEWIVSNDNPLDYWDVGTLSISSPEFSSKYNYSDIDINYKDYGYNVFVKDKRVRWENNNTGVGFDFCQDLAVEIMNKSKLLDKFRFGSFSYPIIREFMSHKELLTTSHEYVRSKWLWQRWQTQKRLAYKERLYEQLNIENKGTISK